MHNTSRKSKFRRPRYNAVAAVAAWSLALSVPAFAAAPRTCDVARVVARVLPSVVNISVAKVLRADGPNGKATGPEHLEFFVGSGVIVEPSGVIITNQHVIQDAARINVTFAGPVIEDAPPTVIQSGSPATDQGQNAAVCTPMLNDPPAPGA